MKVLFAALAAFAALLPLGATHAARADDLPSNSMVLLDDNNGDGGYRPAKTEVYQAFREQMIKRKPLEEYAEFMSPVRLLKPIKVRMEECGHGPFSSPLYQSNERALVMCYEFMKTMEDVATTVVKAQAQGKSSLPFPVTHDGFVAGLFAGVILHESGHALFDNFDVPLFGRQEDAADQMAAVVALQFNHRVADLIMSAYADLWLLFGRSPVQAPNTNDPNYPKDEDARCQLDPFCHFSDTHGSNEQRFFNTVCLMYGSDPVRYANLIKLNLLPKDRDCVGEYKRVRHAFELTIYPFIDHDLMQKVLTMSWFTPNEMK